MTMIIIFPIKRTFSLSIFTLFLPFFTPVFLRPPTGSCLLFPAFIIPVLSDPVFLFSSCSLVSFNHPLLFSESRLWSSTEGPESLLIIPQHVSHLHKHAAKNNPFPCQPTYTLEIKKIPLICEDASTCIFPSPKITGFAFCSGFGTLSNWIGWVCHVTQTAQASWPRMGDYLNRPVKPQSCSGSLCLPQPQAHVTHSTSPAVQLGSFDLTLILWQMGDNLEIHKITHFKIKWQKRVNKFWCTRHTDYSSFTSVSSIWHMI